MYLFSKKKKGPEMNSDFPQQVHILVGPGEPGNYIF